MTDSPYLRRIKWLDVSIQRGTDAVPDDGRYHVLHGAEIRHSTGSLPVAEAHLELLEEEIQAANPGLKNPRDRLVKERSFSDVMSVRGEARNRARSQAEAKGGKGGRSGV